MWSTREHPGKEPTCPEEGHSSTCDVHILHIFSFWELCSGHKATSQHQSAESHASNLIHLPDPRLSSKEGDGFPLTLLSLGWGLCFFGAWSSAAGGRHSFHLFDRKIILLELGTYGSLLTPDFINGPLSYSLPLCQIGIIRSWCNLHRAWKSIRLCSFSLTVVSGIYTFKLKHIFSFF